MRPGESAQRNAKFGELKSLLQSKREEFVAAESSSGSLELQTFTARLEKYSALHSDLAFSHQQLMASHEELSGAHFEAEKALSEDCSQLHLQLEAESENSEVLEQRYDTEIAYCRSTLVRLGELAASDLDASEGRWKATDSLMQEEHRKFEVGLHAVEAWLEDSVLSEKRINDVEECPAELQDAHHTSQDHFEKCHDGLRELRAQISPKLDDQTQKHNDLCTLLESERHARVQHLIEHGRKLKDLGRQLEEESADHDMKFYGFKSLLQLERVAWLKLLLQLQAFTVRLDTQSTSHDELASSHQQLVASHKLWT